METVFFIIAKTISIILDIAYFGMLARMLLPLFINVEESRLYAIAFALTEPFVAPVRFIMFKLNIGQNSPVDWSFFVASLLIYVLKMFLPAI